MWQDCLIGWVSGESLRLVHHETVSPVLFEVKTIIRL